MSLAWLLLNRAHVSEFIGAKESAMRESKWPTKLLNCLLVGALLSGAFPHRPACAELVATESVLTPARLRAVLDRQDVQAQLQAYGVSAEEAAARVAD